MPICAFKDGWYYDESGLMNTGVLVIGDNWEKQLDKYCLASDPTFLWGRELWPTSITNLDPAFKWFINYRLGGLYQGSLLALPNTNFEISQPPHPEKELHVRACDRVRNGDLDRREIEQLRIIQAHNQSNFFKQMSKFWGVPSLAAQERSTTQTMQAWIREEKNLLEDVFPPIPCDGIILEGEFYLSGNGTPFGEPILPPRIWRKRLWKFLLELEGRVWLTMVDCLIYLHADPE